jgi:hypothetical protein
VVKAWLSDLGVEIASLGIQVHGGVGYVEETGCAQYLRDARIAPIYEGTNGIQAADLVMRKLGAHDGELARCQLRELRGIESRLARDLESLREPIAAGIDALERATVCLQERERQDQRAAAAAATPYLRLFGSVAGACQLAHSASAAAATETGDFAAARLTSARFYAEQLLPRDTALLPSVLAGDDALYAVHPTQLAGL